MSWFRWFRRDDDERQLRREVEAHLAERVDDLREAGLPEAEARQQARREFGNAVLHLEDSRQVWHWRWLDDARRDAQYAVRTLARSPGFTAVAVLTLALGIGMSAALFSVIDSALLRRLPYPDPEELVSITIETGPADHVDRAAPSASDVRRWREIGRVFSHVGVGQFARPLDESIAEAPDPEPVMVGETSEDFLEVYGITPRLGRPIGLEDMRQGSPAVVLLGHSYWVTRFGADPQVLGRVVRLNRAPVTIIGVLPEGFYNRLALWRPTLTAITRPDARSSGTAVHGRLRRGLSRDQVARELTEFTRQIHASRGESFDGRVVVQPLLKPLTDSQVSVMGLMAGAVGFVLLIACVNVAGLLLARGTMRQPELAVRTALGASRPRLIRQLLTESLMLSLVGAIAGLLVASLTLDMLVGLVPLSLPPNSPAELNLNVLGAALALALLLPLMFGLWPALRLSRAQLGTPLGRAGGRHGPALSRRGGQLLTGVEIALTVVLLAGAGLMVRSFDRLLRVDLGFDPESLLTMEVRPVDPAPAARAAYYPELLRAIRQLPGVAAAGGIDVLPLAETYVRLNVSASGRQLTLAHALPGYFEALGSTPLAGRLPNEDHRRAGRDVAVLNETMASQLFPGGSAVGESLQILNTSFHILGVVADIRRSPLVAAEPMVYLPYGSRPLGNRLPQVVVVRPSGQLRPSALAASLRQTAQSIGPPAVIGHIRSGADLLGGQVAQQRNQTLLLALFGSFGLLVTLVGIFSVTAFAAARRTHEIGVRMAFGARPGHVVCEVVRDAAWPVAIGLGAGLTGAFFATRVLSNLLFQTAPTDPATFATVAVALAASALFAAWLPARRAARVDPVVALRMD
jgi:predicted permease